MNVIIVQDQVLIGTVLGGSSLVKPPKGLNYYLAMRSQEEIWLKYKMAEMPGYFKSISVAKCGNGYRCYSACDSALTKIHAEMYDGSKRKANMEVLNKLMDIGIAVWYLDNGGKTGRQKKNAYLNTTKFGDEGSEIVCQYFNEVDMPCNVNKNGTRRRVVFTVEGTKNLFDTITSCFPDCMYHRLP
jgi:LAGLIDADG DNA endonuclease family protein